MAGLTFEAFNKIDEFRKNFLGLYSNPSFMFKPNIDGNAFTLTYTGRPITSIQLFVVGCQGVSTAKAMMNTEGEDGFFSRLYKKIQKTDMDQFYFPQVVGKRLEDFLNQNILPITFLLGDNHYPFGIGSSNDVDACFKANFHDYDYGYNVFSVLGNHCWNIWSWAWIKRDTFLDRLWRVWRQIDYTYSTKNLTYGLKKWNMPYRYYKIVIPGIAIFYCIDSTSFVVDIVQQNWLYKQVCSDDPNLKKILVSHHPMVTFGKRAKQKGKVKDYNLYNNIFKGDFVNATNEFGANNNLCSYLFYSILKLFRYVFPFSLVLAAHDHNIGLHRLNIKTLEVAAGGGGAKLEEPILSGLNESEYAEYIDGKKTHGFATAILNSVGIYVSLFNKNGMPIMGRLLNAKDLQVPFPNFPLATRARSGALCLGPGSETESYESGSEGSFGSGSQTRSIRSGSEGSSGSGSGTDTEEY